MKKITKLFAKKLIPKRNKAFNKTDYGNVIVIGGSEKFLGASILCALSASRSGSGYTHLMSDLSKFPWLTHPDLIVHKFQVSSLNKMKNFSIAIGPGLGKGELQKKILHHLVKNNFEKVVVDADALSILSKSKIKKLNSNWILTPHEGELARLLNVSSKLVSKNRLKYAMLLHKKYSCHILLKGPECILIDDQGNSFSTKFGNSALAKAGTGDVLTGIITTQLNLKLNSMQAMIVGNYIHGEAAQKYLKMGNNERSLRPTDLIDLIPKVISRQRS